MRKTLPYILTLYLFNVSSVVLCGEPSQVRDFLPRWQIGEWWVVETEFVSSWYNDPSYRNSNLEIRMSGFVEWRIFKVRHKFEVESLVDLDETKYYIVTMKSVDLPEGVRDAKKEDWLYKLWIRQNDMTLKSYEYRLRERLYKVEGDLVDEGKREFPSGAIAMPIDHYFSPIDVPRLPDILETWKGIPKEYIKSTSMDEEYTNKEVVQSLSIVTKRNNDGNISPQLIVTMQNPIMGIRREIWSAHKPWFDRWDCITADGIVKPGALSAQLVEFGLSPKDHKNR
jgi:hypothetical protein